MACVLCFSTMQVRNLGSRCDACLLGRSECLETLLIASASQVQWLCSTSCRPATFRYAYQQKQLQDPFFRTVHLLCDLLACCVSCLSPVAVVNEQPRSLNNYCNFCLPLINNMGGTVPLTLFLIV